MSRNDANPCKLRKSQIKKSWGKRQKTMNWYRAMTTYEHIQGLKRKNINSIRLF